MSVTTFKEWLEHNRRTPSPFRFKVFDFNERDNFVLNQVHDYLESLFIKNSIDTSFIEKLSAHVGCAEIGEYIKTAKIPTTKSLKSGKIGEVISTTLLEEFFTYEVPLRKLHYAIIGNHSLPSNDIVGIKLFDGKISEVCFVESKLRTYKDKMAVKEGYEQLIQYYNKKGIPIMIGFIMEMMHKEKNPMEEIFMEYCSNRDGAKDSFRITAIMDEDDWDEDILNNLKEIFGESDDDLSVDVVKIEKLKEMISTVYSRLGCLVVE